jgi:DNA-binding NtrC family response regulator
VLIVEDEALLALLMEDTLRDAGAEIPGIASSVEDALNRITTADGPRIDTAVVGLDLGGQPAIPVLDALAAAGIPFVVATGFNGMAALGDRYAVHILQKPFAPEELVRAVAALPAGAAMPRDGASSVG